MSKLTVDGFFFCVIACAACNGDTGGASADPFVGKWSCTDQLSITFTSPPGVPVQNTSQTSTLNISAADGVLTASKGGTDGGMDCKVAFTSNGSTAALNDGQTCATSEGFTLKYKSGSATVSASTMTSTFDFEATGNVPVGGVVVPATATGTQTSTCSRLSPPPGQTTTTGGGGW